MTAINLWACGNWAAVVTDQGHFSIDGTIERIGTKTLALPSLPMTISFSGIYCPEMLTEELDRLVLLGRVSTILAALPEALRRVVQRLKAELPAGRCRVNLYVAAYNRETNRAGVYAVLSEPIPTHPLWPPFMVHDLGPGLVGPTIDLAAFGPMTDIVKDGWNILQAQRRGVFLDPGCRVAGAGELYVIDAEGVSVRAVGRFPETVGMRANPRNPGRPLTDTMLALA